MKTILITGASSGIGAATVRHFQAKGWNVIGSVRSVEALRELAQKLPEMAVPRKNVAAVRLVNGFDDTWNSSPRSGHA